MMARNDAKNMILEDECGNKVASENILSLTSVAKPLLQAALKLNPLAIDATAGNGHDTLFLAENLPIFPTQLTTQLSAPTHTADSAQLTTQLTPTPKLTPTPQLTTQLTPTSKLTPTPTPVTVLPRILAFEPQAIARANTSLRLGELAIGVELLALGHETMAEVGRQFLQEHIVAQRLIQEQLTGQQLMQEDVAAGFGVIMFNLGFLPGSNKEITTKASSTKQALLAALDLLALHGILSIHCYTGKHNDPYELEIVHQIMQALSLKHWRVLSLRQENKLKNTEELWLVERIKIEPIRVEEIKIEKIMI